MKYLLLYIVLITGSTASCRFDARNRDQDDQDLKSSKGAERTVQNKDDDVDDPSAADDIKPFDGKSVSNHSNKPVSIEELKDLFPVQLQGMTRSNLSGDRVGALGFKLSTVKATYRRNDQKLKLEVVDFGGLTSMLSDLAEWSDSDVSHEDDDGYSKVAEWHGCKSFEKSDTKHKESSIAFIYKDRLIVNASGDQVALEDLKNILEDNLLKKLDKIDLKEKD